MRSKNIWSKFEFSIEIWVGPKISEEKICIFGKKLLGSKNFEEKNCNFGKKLQVGTKWHLEQIFGICSAIFCLTPPAENGKNASTSYMLLGHSNTSNAINIVTHNALINRSTRNKQPTSIITNTIRYISCFQIFHILIFQQHFYPCIRRCFNLITSYTFEYLILP